MILYLIYCEVLSAAGSRTMNIKALLFTYSKLVFLWMLALLPRHEQERLQMISDNINLFRVSLNHPPPQRHLPKKKKNPVSVWCWISWQAAESRVRAEKTLIWEQWMIDPWDKPSNCPSGKYMVIGRKCYEIQLLQGWELDSNVIRNDNYHYLRLIFFAITFYLQDSLKRFNIESIHCAEQLFSKMPQV